jgi:hypothetical protein
VLEPKIYTSNGLETIRLLRADGSEFHYEGRVDYDTDQVFKDSQGRAYYLVTTDLGKGIIYYVEVEPKGKPIPILKKGVLPEKDISGLVVSSPRENAKMPSKETFSKPIEQKPVETPHSAPVFPADKPVNGFGKPIEQPAGEEADEQIAPPSEEEHEHAIEAMESIKPKKKRSLLKITLAVAAIVIILLAIIAGGLYVYKPDWVKSHVPFLATPTPVPTIAPTITATPEPTITPTPQPTAPTMGPDFYNNLYAIGAAIKASNESVMQFANNHTGTNSGIANNNMTHTLDVFDYVNANWANTAGNTTPDNASVIVNRLSGNDRDYSIAMAAIAESLGETSRVVEAFNDDNVTYYPEILVASNDGDYTNVKQYLKSRYISTDAFGNTEGTQYWISLAMGKAAGIKVNSTYEYAVDSSSGVSPLK